MNGASCSRLASSSSSSAMTPAVSARLPPRATAQAPARRSRRCAVAVRATLVGPDPRLAMPPPGPSSLPLKGREVEEAAMWRCIQAHQESPNGILLPRRIPCSDSVLAEAYDRCGQVTSEYAKTFYLGTQLMTPKQARAIWAVYVWCRRTDELVDGPNASRITPKALDRWEERLEALFEGRPYDVLDAALTDTIAQFPLHIQPFRDMIEGMRMDLVKSRYQTFDELYEYCYRVAGTVGLMSTPIMGIDPAYHGPMDKVYGAALALGTANQLTNILRDVGEDAAQRNRIYVPLEDMDRFGITEREVLAGAGAPVGSPVVTERWREFMAFQISRAREYFAVSEAGVDFLDQKARWPVWSALILYRQILDAIEANGYDNFTRRAYVPKARKMASLPTAFMRALLPPASPYTTKQPAGAGRR